MRLVRPAVVALLGLTLALSAPMGVAYAAKGPFSWLGAKDRPFFVENLPDGRCFTMSQEAHGAHNGTGTPATIFAGKQCTGKALRLAPGRQAPRGTAFSSVRFGAH
ncbi:hypothetical protein ABZ951_14715 [Streptomyces sp. NPDC046215]|uniref:Uncharacterized protein n=1 Tax=Streptomyces stramineus TaxID=173861 RepID=A0ABP3JRN4_9ACTN